MFCCLFSREKFAFIRLAILRILWRPVVSYAGDIFGCLTFQGWPVHCSKSVLGACTFGGGGSEKRSGTTKHVLKSIAEANRHNVCVSLSATIFAARVYCWEKHLLGKLFEALQKREVTSPFLSPDQKQVPTQNTRPGFSQNTFLFSQLKNSFWSSSLKNMTVAGGLPFNLPGAVAGEEANCSR